jgi:hypothetical protein
MKKGRKNCCPPDFVFSHLNKSFWSKEKYAKGDVGQWARENFPKT